MSIRVLFTFGNAVIFLVQRRLTVTAKVGGEKEKLLSGES
jgi:hypothetical protein